MANLDQIMDYLADSTVYEATSVSASSAYSSGAMYLFKNKLTNSVIGYGFVNKTSNIGTSETFFSIPEGWRPVNNCSGVGFFWSNSAGAAYRIAINTSGAIQQGYSSATRSIMFLFNYVAA